MANEGMNQVLSLGILLAVGVYVVVKLKSSLNDTQADTVFDDIINGIQDASGLIGIAFIILMVAFFYPKLRNAFSDRFGGGGMNSFR